MDSDRIKGKWKQIKGRIKEEWGDLRDDDLDEAEGHRDYLIGKVQERYGIGKDEARKQVEAFEHTL
ncbi:CsbD family protein [Guyparkeria hydrothermalis]|uniref:CsbD family protein n=1 Tax=Guyparkeria TaxID=2035712 RepID=UPI0010AD9134|nr:MULTISPECIES: CsbD family protein [Guyparkeria]MCL7750133.1 CsbD family protein [Guyparkeria hydrothermalis]TKA89236.1 CsbD family protein [Guyparkeria sp. SB14A]